MSPAFPVSVPAAASPRPSGCTCARLRRLTRRVTAIYDRELAPAGLRVTQYALLSVLQREGGPPGMPVSRLAERMDMDRTTLTRNLQPLLKQRWVALRSDAQDRRVRLAAITPDGLGALEAARPLWQRAQCEVERILGPDTVAVLHRWLDEVTPRFRLPTGEEA